LPPDVALRYEIELISLNDEWENSVYRTSDETSLDKPLTNT